MNSVIERFGSMDSYQITSSALNFTLCAVFLFLAYVVFKGKLVVNGLGSTKQITLICAIVIALLNGVSGGLNFV